MSQGNAAARPMPSLHGRFIGLTDEYGRRFVMPSASLWRIVALAGDAENDPSRARVYSGTEEIDVQETLEDIATLLGTAVPHDA